MTLATERRTSVNGLEMTQIEIHQRLNENLARVRMRVAESCRRSGRDPGEVRLVAVTKYVPPELISSLVELGATDIGESRVQQLVRRAELLGSDAGGLDDSSSGEAPRWHMIGHLQRNKVKTLLRHARIIHSVDSTRLADEIQKQAEPLGGNVDVFIEVNVSGEAAKGGVDAESAAALAEHVCGLRKIRLCGLMTMAPLSDDAEAARPHFARLRVLRDRLRECGAAAPTCEQLSMGMSADFCVAIEEGATLVRVGSLLFAGVPRESVPGAA